MQSPPRKRGLGWSSRLAGYSPGLGAQTSPDVLRLRVASCTNITHHISDVKGKQSSIILLRTNLVFFL